MRTAKKMGIQTVAIYSDIDRNSKFVDLADKAYRVGPNPSSNNKISQLKAILIHLKFYKLHNSLIVLHYIQVLDFFPKMQALLNNVIEIILYLLDLLQKQ